MNIITTSFSKLKVGTIFKINQAESFKLHNKLAMVVEVFKHVDGTFTSQVIDLQTGEYLIGNNNYKFECEIIREGSHERNVITDDLS